MESHYQSQNMTITNAPAVGCNLVFAYALAQQSSCSVVIFDNSRNVIYLNNRLRTFDHATDYDRQCVSTICDYMNFHYYCSDIIKKHLLGIYIDYSQREFSLKKYTGELVNFKLVPVFNGHCLHGVILLANIKGEQHGKRRMCSMSQFNEENEKG